MRTLIIINILLFSFTLSSQIEYHCGGPDYNGDYSIKSDGCAQTSSDINDYYRRYEYQKDLYSMRNSMVIPIDIYVWQKDNGTENYLDNQINRDRLTQIITYLDGSFYNNNSTPSFQPLPNLIDYDSTKIRFRLKNIYFEKNTSCWNKGITPSYSDGVYLNSVANTLHPEGINNFKIHITGMETTNHSGYATFPSSDFNHQHFIVTKNSIYDTTTHEWTHEEFVNASGLWGFAGHLAHEFGHNFDLYHTYCYDSNQQLCQNYYACNESSPDYLDDVFGSSQNNSKECPQKAGWSCDIHNPNNNCTNNIMGGTKSAGYFSPKQVRRMHRALSLLSIRKYAVAYNFDENKFIEVNNDQTWDFSTKLYNNLKIKSGTTLTIKCAIHFVPQAKVVIEPGGKLIIDGGTLTNETYYNDFWQGIQVYGTTDKNQFPEHHPTHQGLLVVKNGGIIKNAHKAVSNWHQDKWNEIGGVIQVNDGVFRNNRRDIEFMSYQNYTPNYSNKYRNLSYFRNTDFTSNDDFIEKGLPWQTHVTLWEVDGVTFTNCHFSNEVTNDKDNSSAPQKGIYSVNAGYKVAAGCNAPFLPIGQPCPTANLLKSSFKGFNTAIEATGAGTSETVSVRQTDFDDNIWGIVIDEFDNVSLNRNTIEVGEAGYTLFWHIGAGVMIDNSTGYNIEENVVTTNLPSGLRVGININRGVNINTYL